MNPLMRLLTGPEVAQEWPDPALSLSFLLPTTTASLAVRGGLCLAVTAVLAATLWPDMLPYSLKVVWFSLSLAGGYINVAAIALWPLVRSIVQGAHDASARSVE